MAWDEGRLRRGQATLEYALVLCSFVVVVTTLALLLGAARDGRLARAATSAASHSLESPVGLAKDLALY